MKINPKNTASTSHSATDDALQALVRMLARQAATGLPDLQLPPIRHSAKE